MKKMLVMAGLMTLGVNALAEEAIDASDPTKIYSFAGPGYKYTEFTNGDTLEEVRVMGNLGLSPSDMVLFEIGYGEYSRKAVNGPLPRGEDESGLTNSRARWFHLFNMNYEVISGYRGWATQVDLQIEGDVYGTKGSNTIALGALPAYGLNENWSFFLPVNVISTWDHDFNNHQGNGVSVAPLLVHAPPEGPWPGYFLQIWPNISRYFSGDLDGEGGSNVDLVLGGSLSEKTVLSATFQRNFDKGFNSFSRGVSAPQRNDWNLFASISWYF